MSCNILRYVDGQLAHYTVTDAELRAKILSSLKWLSKGLHEQGWKNIRDPETLVDLVLTEFYLLEVDNTLIAFSVSEPWFINGRLISEEFIAPFADPPAQINRVVEALEATGKSCGCCMLSLGTRANPRQQGLARLFQQTGAMLSTIELVKDISDGQGIQENCEGGSQV